MTGTEQIQINELKQQLEYCKTIIVLCHDAIKERRKQIKRLNELLESAREISANRAEEIHELKQILKQRDAEIEDIRVTALDLFQEKEVVHGALRDLVKGAKVLVEAIESLKA